MKMQESPEDYLEAILILSERKQDVHSVDVAHFLGYTKPSVSVAMKRLRENGYVEMDEHGVLTLTDPGLSIASKIYERHRVLTEYFKSIGVSPAIAERDACRIEHVISDETFDRIKALKQLSES